ncbi:KGK domain-containing protein [Anabaena sp. UHCC 0187]|uniref:KGK domain-containing protein n=1 Tax=Anabaena sp. UHCC 0187 TaxID=2590018 RepID=UPI0014457CF5|nr:KGK domain-containing protein [Anabaena sp. UHCC 0187]MDP5018603.1 KGK domain-containing protein [Dolichospermum sp.]MTJ13622.1 KGK domain-containing protein [Anabaena sp. UHCC 0187]
MSHQFDRLDENDVISINPENFDRLDVSKTLTAVELIEAIKDYIGADDPDAKLFTAGIEAKVLRPGDSWKKGKIRVAIEFLSDEPEVKKTIVNNNLGVNQETSPLDDLRDKLKDIES